MKRLFISIAVIAFYTNSFSKGGHIFPYLQCDYVYQAIEISKCNKNALNPKNEPVQRASGKVIGEELKPSDSRWQYKSNQPAKTWQEGLLTGNGKHGTMVMGIPGNERITCVHEELFMPHMDPDVNPVTELKSLLPKVRDLVLNNESNEASQLVLKEANRQFEEKGLPPATHWGPTPHPAFDLVLEQKPAGVVKNYKRQLDLETGEALVSWEDDQGLFEERVFSSRFHNLNVISPGQTHEKKSPDFG